MEIHVGKYLIDSSEISSARIQELLAKYHGHSSLKIHCSCNEKALMHIRKFKDKYVISTNPHKLKAHAPYCENGLDLSDNQLQGAHYRVIEVINDRELRVNARYLPIFITEEKENTGLTTNPVSKAYTASSMTLGSFGREWLSRAWEYVIELYQTDKKFYPSIKVIQIALNKLFVRNDSIYNVKLTKKTNLSDVLWIGQKKPQSFHYYNQNKIRPVILCQLNKEKVHYDVKNNYMVLSVAALTKDVTYEVAVSLDHWETAIKNCRVNYNNHDYFYITGYGVTGEFGKLPMVDKLELIPITMRGMFVDSLFEAQLFEQFEAHRRIYKRSNQRIDTLNGYQPDAFLLDTEKPCIVEVFGMSESNILYHEAKNRKMQFYRTLQDYSTFYWHAYRNNKIPDLPDKKNKTLSS